MKFYSIIFVIILFLGGFMGFLTIFNKKTKESNISAELQEEVENFSLKITGTIPNWLSGTLIRNGPIKVNYSNKFLRSDAYQTVFMVKALKNLGELEHLI